MAMARQATKSTLMTTTMTKTGNEFDVDGDGATGDDNEDNDDGGGDGAMGSSATGYDDDDDDYKTMARR
jgi:hypothetical protein